MDTLSQFIKYVKLDEEKRILISVQNQFESYLQDTNTRSMLKQSVQSILKEDFELMEVGKNVCRITVKEGTEEKNLELVKTELVKGLEVAMTFLSQMGNMGNQ
ncbi:hypothetical protein R9X47_00475 [Wukongibacter baidiensis]|uniref:hypothetical protein n=1 Tax=Wukongibacter baidiensis TaxID=1723361 RepID=UPI003D7FAF4F